MLSFAASFFVHPPLTALSVWERRLTLLQFQVVIQARSRRLERCRKPSSRLVLVISDSDLKPIRFGIRTLLVFLTLIAVVLLAVSAILDVKKSIRGSYAAWWTADMCIEHMAANNGKWPRSWDDLRDDYQTCVERSGQPWTFDELSSQVEIDWEASPIERLPIDDDSDNDLRVIWLRGRSVAHWHGREPNTMIFEYLKSLPASAHSKPRD